MTPMIEQYIKIKNSCKDSILFYRMGDFYEMFYSDAEIAAKTLDIVLTTRGKKTKNSVPMCGVPFNNANYYIKKLLKANYKISICEQVETPEEAKKKGKNIVARKVVKIITPGTVIEDDLLNNKKNNYIASINFNNNEITIAWVEISTGEFKVLNTKKCELLSQLGKIDPKEIILQTDIMKNKFFSNIIKRIKAHITYRDSHFFNIQTCRKTITEYYKIQSITGIGLSNDLHIISSGSLLEYLIYTQKSTMPKIRIPKVIHESEYLNIDYNTKEQLEITYSKSNKFTLYNAINKTVTASGSRLLEKRINFPYYKKNPIIQSHNIIEYFILNYNLCKTIRIELKEFPDVARAITRIYKFQPKITDLYIIKKGIKVIEKIKNLLIEQQNYCIKEISYLTTRISNDEFLNKSLDNYLYSKYSDKQDRIIKEGSNSTIDELYIKKNNFIKKICALQETYIKKTKIYNLKIVKNKVLGYFIEITNIHAKKIHDSIFIIKQRLGNTKRFITKELKEIEESLLSTENKISILEKQVLNLLYIKIRASHSMLNLSTETIGKIDFFSSLSVLAKERNYIRPHINNTEQLIIKKGRHPIVEYYKSSDFIPNDINLTRKNIWLITGANMAGKSTFLRQNALICIMAQMGSFIPAHTATIGLIDKIFSRIGASDNISENESTFMKEMNETANILNNATYKSLIIFDEIGRGTEIHDGISIAWSVVQYINQYIHCKTLFTTHYKELERMAKIFHNISNYTLVTKEHEDKIIFLYNIIPGTSKKSYGLYIAKIAGFPQKAMDIAYSVSKKNKDTKHQNKQNIFISTFAKIKKKIMFIKNFVFRSQKLFDK